jgi:hypothetical protein
MPKTNKLTIHSFPVLDIVTSEFTPLLSPLSDFIETSPFQLKLSLLLDRSTDPMICTNLHMQTPIRSPNAAVASQTLWSSTPTAIA